MHQTGGDYLTKFKASLYGQGGQANSTLWGLRGGVKFGANDLALSYNKLEDQKNSFGGGALVSPYGDYTAMYAAVMTANLIQYGPGDATQLAYTRSLFDKHVALKVAVLKFNTTNSGNSNTVYIDATYHFDGKLKGLSVRDRLARDNGAKINGGQTFVYNRLMLQYNF